ncbi:hypothetical protein [Roseibium sp.]
MSKPKRSAILLVVLFNRCARISDEVVERIEQSRLLVRIVPSKQIVIR